MTHVETRLLVSFGAEAQRSPTGGKTCASEYLSSRAVRFNRLQAPQSHVSDDARDERQMMCARALTQAVVVLCPPAISAYKNYLQRQAAAYIMASPARTQLLVESAFRASLLLHNVGAFEWRAHTTTELPTCRRQQ